MTYLSCGKLLKKSCELGIKYVNQAIGSKINYGKGHGPINHLNSIKIIEWPELGKGSIAKADISIKLSGNAESREAKISFESKLGRSIKKCVIG